MLDLLGRARAMNFFCRRSCEGATLLWARAVVILLFAAMLRAGSSDVAAGAAFENAFVNFETAPVHPIAISPDGQKLAVCNLPDGRLELFNISSGTPILIGSVPVGLDPTSVRFRNNEEAWVVNHVSDSVSIVDVTTLHVTATLDTLDTPADVVFAGAPQRAYVSCALPNRIQVFDPANRLLVTNVVIAAERPKALAVSPDGQKVYAAIFESGNGTTIVGAKFRNLLFFSNAVSVATGPYSGQNPPPNAGTLFNPPINPTIPTNIPAPATGIIVRKNDAGRWLDDNNHDWTEFVSGTNAFLTQRVEGWDLPDRDLAIIDAATFSVDYASGLMNICMAVDVNPVSGRIAVVGTDAINEVRFEPNLNGIFSRMKLATVDPVTSAKRITDLNPHLNYASPLIPAAERDKSIGDPRAIALTADGTRAYVAGMGSRNVILMDATGSRVHAPIEVGEGPCGLALDSTRNRLYVFNRFSSSISVVDTSTDSVIDSVPLFDPTPLPVAAGRKHLYDTRRTSGLGQVSCASCHVDGRMDRLGWDLGNQAGSPLTTTVNKQGTLVTNDYHPMKGVMVTQTLQDVIGHEPFHWRGDRVDIQAFNGTFTNLQGAPSGLSAPQMRELRDFLASIRFPPNPYRAIDNSLSTNVPLPGHIALGEDVLPSGTPFASGNAVRGLDVFRQPGNFCVTCHTLPTGLGLDATLQNGIPKSIAAGTNGEHHFPLAFRLEGPLRSKIAQFRNLSEKIGVSGTAAQSQAGFGFGHDGSVDSLTRFLNGVRVANDTDVADLIAFLISSPGSDTGSQGAPPDSTPPSGTGKQLTISSLAPNQLFQSMLLLAQSPSGRVELIAKGLKNGVQRGWWFDRSRNLFQSDRLAEVASPGELLTLAGAGSELTFTLVLSGTGVRLGIDRDLDGSFDRDEIDGGSDPATIQLRAQVLLSQAEVPVGGAVSLYAQLPPLSAAGTISWWKNGNLISATSDSIDLTNVSASDTGDYVVRVTTPFQTLTSDAARLSVVPLLITASPETQSIRRGSNALFTATATGAGPFSYQWQFNGNDVTGATANSLALTNVQLGNEGWYAIRAANSFGSITSAPVRLDVLINPSLLIAPLSQTVVEGGTATFSFSISGHPAPFGYFLRKSSSTLTGYVSPESSGFLSLPNVQLSNAGTYRIVITNAANPSPGLSLDPVTLTVLSDFDHDGLPDIWESAHGFQTNNAADAQLDSDLDGQTNWQEYLAGTDPRDPLSFLRIENISLGGASNAVVLQFNALSNQTYTIQSRDGSLQSPWTRVADFVAFPTNRLMSFTNTATPFPARYYRLVTPWTP